MYDPRRIYFNNFLKSFSFLLILISILIVIISFIWESQSLRVIALILMVLIVIGSPLNYLLNILSILFPFSWILKISPQFPSFINIALGIGVLKLFLFVLRAKKITLKILLIYLLLIAVVSLNSSLIRQPLLTLGWLLSLLNLWFFVVFYTQKKVELDILVRELLLYSAIGFSLAICISLIFPELQDIAKKYVEIGKVLYIPWANYKRFCGLLADPNYFAQYSIVLTSAMAYFYKNKPRVAKQKGFYIGMLYFFIFFVTFLTFSKMYLFYSVFIIFYSLGYFIHLKITKSNFTSGIVVVILLILVIGFSLKNWGNILFEGYRYRLFYEVRYVGVTTKRIPTELYYLTQIPHRFLHLFLGYGLGEYLGFIKLDAPSIGAPHNIFLDFLYSVGFIGTIGFILYVKFLFEFISKNSQYQVNLKAFPIFSYIYTGFALDGIANDLTYFYILLLILVLLRKKDFRNAK